MTNTFFRTCVAAFSMAASVHAMAQQQVLPSSYTFDQATGCGTWCYHDASYTKLTDGVVGNAGWALHQGEEWVGWHLKPVINIDFSFSSAQAFSSVSIGSTQDYLYNVALPSFDLWSFEANRWALKGSIVNPPNPQLHYDRNSPAAHPVYTFSNLSFSSDLVRVSVRSNGTYTFVDEVTFQATPVPEPESYAMLLLGLGFLGALARRRQSKR